jgi:hypothetical protein
MPKLTVKVRYPTVDKPRTVRKIHKELTAFVIDVLREWVSETTSPVPVWSGAARASFLTAAATAQTSVQIDPVAPSRISLGVTEASFTLIATPGKAYGFEWASDLAHIGVVQDRVDFLGAGEKVIKASLRKVPKVPIVYKTLRK